MLRVVIALLWIGVTVYALADWWRTPEERCPGRIPKALWLLLILLTIPSFSIGSIAWVILRAVARAEARQRGETLDDDGLLSTVRDRVAPTAPPAPAPVAPDDDPEFLFRLERDLARKRAEERAAEEKAKKERLAREREEERAAASTRQDAVSQENTAGPESTAGIKGGSEVSADDVANRGTEEADAPKEDNPDEDAR
ncbi:hypothetical protein [Schaalia sp. Marseille-Q2122]|uniref:hypothetical protein n=1 Tax=Schaalia sp. Marseille-Q2122 TaxID=2736604 RepID=UPI0020CA8CFF|nr:hypothetical protein [Schaalia sp. Marseille-Q2122]